MKLEQLETKRFFLRKVDIKDNKDIFEILSDEETTKYLNMKRHVNLKMTDDMINEYLNGVEEKTKYPFAIIDKETNCFIGVILVKLDLYDEDCFEFTIYINKKYWNRGIYTEVIKPIIKFSFEEIKTGNFRGFVMEENESSCRVLEKSGFSLEKIFSVPGIEGRIKSYLITMDEYKNRKI